MKNFRTISTIIIITFFLTAFYIPIPVGADSSSGGSLILNGWADEDTSDSGGGNSDSGGGNSDSGGGNSDSGGGDSDSGGGNSGSGGGNSGSGGGNSGSSDGKDQFPQTDDSFNVSLMFIGLSIILVVYLIQMGIFKKYKKL